MTQVAALMIGRRGSVGFPGKNTTSVRGRPMAWWPLDAARESAHVSAVYLSTDDPDLAAIGRQIGAVIIQRPAALASREALGEDAYHHAHEWIKRAQGVNAPDIYVLLMANAPTVTSEQISLGVQALLQDPSLDSAVTVSAYNMWSPLRARRMNGEGLLDPFIDVEALGDEKRLSCDRDSQGEVLFADMGMSVVRAHNLDRLNEGLLPQRWMGQRILPIRNEAGLDVDYEYQLGQVDWWLRRNRG